MLAQTQPKPQNKQLKGIFLVIISTLCLSTEAIAAKIAYQGGASVMTTLVFRYTLAALLFWAILLLTRTPANLSVSQLFKVLGLSIGGQAMIAVTLFNSFKYIPAAMAILFLYIYPTITSILAYFILKEPLHRRKLLALGLTLTGCVIILGRPMAGLHPLGVSLALMAAIINALFVVFSSKVLSNIPVPVFNAYMTSSCSVFFIITGLISRDLNFNLTTDTWIALIFLAVVCTVIAMGAFLKGITIIGASRSAIISTLEPAFTGILGVFLLGEILTGWQMVGGAIILSGVLVQKEKASA